MTLRKGHGKGAGVPRIEVLPPDELPAPVPNQAAPLVRRPTGQIADSATAKALGAKGGAAKAKRMRILAGLGLAELAEDHKFKAYESAAEDFVNKHLSVLASMTGGIVGPGPASIVCTAGRQYAASVFLYDKAKETGDAQLFHRSAMCGNDSRQNLLAAYELATREGAARKAEGAAFDFNDIAGSDV